MDPPKRSLPKHQCSATSKRFAKLMDILSWSRRVTRQLLKCYLGRTYEKTISGMENGRNRRRLRFLGCAFEITTLCFKEVGWSENLWCGKSKFPRTNYKFHCKMFEVWRKVVEILSTLNLGFDNHIEEIHNILGSRNGEENSGWSLWWVKILNLSMKIVVINPWRMAFLPW